jgi:hypothetical protein
MAPYSMDLHTRVLADCDAGVAAKEVAAKFRVSRSWVNRLVQRAARRARSGGGHNGCLRSKRSPAKSLGCAPCGRPARSDAGGTPRGVTQRGQPVVGLARVRTAPVDRQKKRDTRTNNAGPTSWLSVATGASGCAA